MGNVVAFGKKVEAVQDEGPKESIKTFVEEFMKADFASRATKVFIVIEDDEGEEMTASLNYSDMELLWLSKEIEYNLSDGF